MRVVGSSHTSFLVLQEAIEKVSSRGSLLLKPYSKVYLHTVATRLPFLFAPIVLPRSNFPSTDSSPSSQNTSTIS